MLAPAEQWAQTMFGDVDLGDRRRNQRAVKIAAAMAARPDASIPRQMGDVHQAKAAYHLLKRSDVVTFDALSNPHHRQTRADLGGHRRVLLIGDTTEVNYTAHHATSGLELTGDGRGRGFNLHSVLAVTPDRRVLGMAHQNLFYRQQIGKSETRAQRQRRDRESLVWAQAVAKVGKPPPGTQLIHVNDSASDNWPFYQSCLDNGCDWVIRVSQNRRCGAGHDADEPHMYLKDYARSLTPCLGRPLQLSRQPQQFKQPARKPRLAKLQIAAAPLTLFAPGRRRKDAVLRLWVLRVYEVQTPAGVEPLEWILITNLPADTPEQAAELIDLYTSRPLIEEYHKCLKSGCKVESRQLQEGDRLEALLGFAVVVAVRLLTLKQQTRQMPAVPAVRHVEPLMVRVLAACRKLKTPPQELTLYQFWREVARLGGFLGRKGDKEPGWQTTWRGWRELQSLTKGARLARQIDEKSG